MKFGKRRQEAQVPGVSGVTIPSTGSKGSKRRSETTTSAPPAPAAVTDSWTVPHGDPPPPPADPAAPEPAEPLIYADPVVEGEAVELPAAEPAAPVYEPPVPLTLQGAAASSAAAMPDPLADQPVTVVESASGPRPAPVSTLSDSGETFASGHAAAPGPSWQEPLMELANERPEIVVGAAFAGGVLAAMILRRLGN